MVDEAVIDDNLVPAHGGADVVATAAEEMRREVLALNDLGARHAELCNQINTLGAERDALANEYQARYRQLAGGQFMNATLRQLGMGESLGGSMVAKKRRRSTGSRGGGERGVDVPTQAG